MRVVFPAVTDRRYSFQSIPRNTGLMFDFIVAAPRSPEHGILRPFIPPADWAKGTLKIAEKGNVATAILAPCHPVAPGLSKLSACVIVRLCR